MVFKDRHDAGRLLAERLLPLRNKHPVVLALPRGGVPVGLEVARALVAPLDLVLVRKIGVPGNEEFALGAIAEGKPPELVIDEQLAIRLKIPPDYLDEAKAAALTEIGRRRQAYLGTHPQVNVTGCTAIVVDDGIATGATMRAALRATRRRCPARVILAVPAAAPDVLKRLRREVDDVVCLESPDDFMAVGQFYHRFPQLRDAEVTMLLAQAAYFPQPAQT